MHSVGDAADTLDKNAEAHIKIELELPTKPSP